MAPMIRVRSRRVVARRGADQRDRERAGDGVDEERDLPPPVPAGEEEVALDEGVRRLQLVRQQSQGSVLSGSTGSGRSPARDGCAAGHPCHAGAVERSPADPAAESDDRLAHLAADRARRPRAAPVGARNDRSSAWRSLIAASRSSIRKHVMVLSRGDGDGGGLVAVLRLRRHRGTSFRGVCQSLSSSSSTSSSRERPVKVMNTASSVGCLPVRSATSRLSPSGVSSATIATPVEDRDPLAEALRLGQVVRREDDRRAVARR